MGRTTAFAVAALCALPAISAAENIIYPTNSGVIDLRTAFNAPRVGEGDGDATAEIQAALNQHIGGDRILYLPNGTYQVSKTLRWGNNNGGPWETKNLTLQGQSTDGTVILLKASCDSFGDTLHPRGVIWTGSAPAQRFRNNIRNLTVRVGAGNPGACGIQYIANNQGHIMDVKIISDDGTGMTGLDMAFTAEIGPLYIRNVSVTGFNVGIACAAPQNSMTLEHIRIQGQKRLGFLNNGQVVNIRDLVSVNKVVVIENNIPTSVMTLLGGDFSVPAGDTVIDGAIRNYAWLYARNVVTRGYKQAVWGRNPGDQAMVRTTVDEYRSNRVDSLFHSPPRSLDLPVEEPPQQPWDPLDQWVSPTQYGAAGNGSTDDTRAIQSAIDAGKSTVFLDGGKTFVINGTVVVRGAVRTIIGLESNIRGIGGFQIAAGNHDTVFFMHPNGWLDNLTITHPSTRTLVVEGTTGIRYLGSAGAGKVFLTDYCATAIEFGAGQRVFGRQINPEGIETKIINSGATAWFLGIKTERAATILETKNGGTSEVHGIFTYATEGIADMPMLLVTNSALSVTGFGGSCFSSSLCWQTLVQETRAGVTRTLPRTATGLDSRTGEPVLTLYAGYAATDAAPSAASPRPAARTPGRNLLVVGPAAPLRANIDGAYNIRGQDLRGSLQRPRGTGSCRIVVVDDRD